MNKPRLTVTDWDDAAAYVAEHVPDAHRLEAVEAVMDADIHGVWLDEATGAVWHAWADMDVQDAWFIASEHAAEAIEWMEEQCCLVLDALAAPAEHYDFGNRVPEDDLRVLDELNAVRLSAARSQAQAHLDDGAATGEPAVPLTLAVDATILRRIEAARREQTMLAGLRAHHIREEIGLQRGGQARVAAELGVSRATLHNILRADNERRDQIITAARAARAARQDDGA